MRVIAGAVVAVRIAAHGWVRISPAGHLTGTTENVSDEGIPPRAICQTYGANVAAVNEVPTLPRKPIAEESQVDCIAVGVVAVGIERVISFEQHVMGTRHMRSVDANLDPPLGTINPAIVGIVVSYDAPGPG